MHCLNDRICSHTYCPALFPQPWIQLQVIWSLRQNTVAAHERASEWNIEQMLESGKGATTCEGRGHMWWMSSFTPNVSLMQCNCRSGWKQGKGGWRMCVSECPGVGACVCVCVCLDCTGNYSWTVRLHPVNNPLRNSLSQTKLQLQLLLVTHTHTEWHVLSTSVFSLSLPRLLSSVRLLRPHYTTQHYIVLHMFTYESK